MTRVLERELEGRHLCRSSNPEREQDGPGNNPASCLDAAETKGPQTMSQSFTDLTDVERWSTSESWVSRSMLEMDLESEKVTRGDHGGEGAPPFLPFPFPLPLPFRGRFSLSGLPLLCQSFILRFAPVIESDDSDPSCLRL